MKKDSLFQKIGKEIFSSFPPIKRLRESRDACVEKLQTTHKNLETLRKENSFYISLVEKLKNEGIEKDNNENIALISKSNRAQIYGDIVPWELPVQYCARDCINKNDTVFDIGGNIGGVSIALSRMVGVGGRVYTFEPNCEIWPHLLENITINNAENICHVPLACFSESGKILTFYSDPSFYKAGSRLLVEIPGAKRMDVVSISIDDFCHKNSVVPVFLKIDVEGAEIHVLRSAESLLLNNKPAVLIEYQSAREIDSNDPLKYLEDRGYIGFDVNTYSHMTAEDYSKLPDLPLVNVLCLHNNSAIANRYKSMKKTVIFEKKCCNSLVTDEINLDPGRYIFALDFDVAGDAQAQISVEKNGQYLAFYDATATHLKMHSCSHMILDISEKITVIGRLTSPDAKATINSVKVTKVELE